jgi:hypothetical protein
MDLLLTRDPDIPPAPDHLYGVLEIGTMILQTMERPWVPDPGGAVCGDPGQSCVPVGIYQLVGHDTVSHPMTWALVNPDLCVYHEPNDVPVSTVGRSAILLHAGNYASDSEGCILVGLTRGELNRIPAVLSSQTALLHLKAALSWPGHHTLTIE